MGNQSESYFLAVLGVVVFVLGLAFGFVSEDALHEDAEELENVDVADWGSEGAWEGPEETSEQLKYVVNVSGDSPPA